MFKGDRMENTGWSSLTTGSRICEALVLRILSAMPWCLLSKHAFGGTILRWTASPKTPYSMRCSTTVLGGTDASFLQPLRVKCLSKWNPETSPTLGSVDAVLLFQFLQVLLSFRQIFFWFCHLFWLMVENCTRQHEFEGSHSSAAYCLTYRLDSDFGSWTHSTCHMPALRPWHPHIPRMRCLWYCWRCLAVFACPINQPPKDTSWTDAGLYADRNVLSRMHAPYRPELSKKIKQILRRDVVAGPSQQEERRTTEAILWQGSSRM